MDYNERLQQAGVRVTSVRLLVYKTICEGFDNAFSLQDVMNMLPYADNSSVFRTLTLFVKQHLLHQIDDGSGTHKYCVCHCGKVKCHHIHLTCTQCHETICLKDTPLPQFTVPEGFMVEEAEFIVKGVCAKCQRKKLT